MSENIAGGWNLSISNAIFQYWQDESHLYTMLNPAAVYVGAGVGIAGDYVYYTVDAGYYSGAPSTGNTSGSPVEESTLNQPITNYDPFVISTPDKSGSIIHTVGYGQSLIGIANTYKVDLNAILVLNNLTLDSIIHPEDEIIIQAGSTPTPTPTPTITHPSATPSQTPAKKTPTPIPMDTERKSLVYGVVITAFIVLLAVVIASAISRRTEMTDEY